MAQYPSNVNGQMIKLWGVKPEYEACLRLAQAQNVPVRAVYEAAMAVAYQQWVAYH